MFPSYWFMAGLCVLIPFDFFKPSVKMNPEMNSLLVGVLVDFLLQNDTNVGSRSRSTWFQRPGITFLPLSSFSFVGQSVGELYGSITVEQDRFRVVLILSTLAAGDKVSVI